MSQLVPGLSYLEFVSEAWRHHALASFRASDFFARHGPALEALLATALVERCPPDRLVAAAAGPALRLVHWNIEKGKKLDGLKSYLSRDPYLRAAHVYTLNEVDVGMLRSGPNADVGQELARALGCHLVFVPNYIECTRGLPGEAPEAGENERGLHGMAVLSRLPVLGARAEALPECWDYFGFHEKRFGRRRGLHVRVDWGGRPVIVATTHLEMRCAPACRARQLTAFLAGLAAAQAEWGHTGPILLAGDFNTHTFRRGGWAATPSEFLRIVGTPRRRLEEDLLRPFRREPLFGRLKAQGFAVDPVNDGAPTASQDLNTVEDLKLVPAWLGRFLLKTFRLEEVSLRMRLDWIAARGFRPAGSARTLCPGPTPAEPLSDHAPIAVDLTAEP